MIKIYMIKIYEDLSSASLPLYNFAYYSGMSLYRRDRRHPWRPPTLAARDGGGPRLNRYNFTNILPMFSPVKRPIKALGAFSMPSTMVSCPWIWPAAIHFFISA